MRTTKKLQTKGDTYDALLTYVVADDCFGQEWDLIAPECQRCHDQHSCATLAQRILKLKVVEKEKTHGKPYIDQVVMPPAHVMKEKVLPGERINDVIDWIIENYTTPDKVTVEMFVQSHIEEFGLRVKGGVICE